MDTFNAPADPTQKSTEDKFAWIYLVNLTFYLIPLFIDDKPLWQIGLILLTLIPFIYCYFWAYRSPRNDALYPILAMIVLGVAITPINSGSLSLFTFAGFFIGFYYSIRTALMSLLGFIALLLTLTFLLDMSHYYFVAYGSLLIAGVGLFGVAERKRVEAKCREQKSQAEISQLAAMLERERIARDLHDIMGHNLSSISLKAELAAKLLDKHHLEDAKTQLVELTTIARSSLSQVRETVSGYKHQGLASSVMSLCQTLRDKGLSVSLEGDIPNLLPELETHVILSLTELCNNILRHSHADHCSLVFSESTHELNICITDNGQTSGIIEGNGLKGIQERLIAFQGKLDYVIDSQCRFIITLPSSSVIAGDNHR